MLPNINLEIVPAESLSTDNYLEVLERRLWLSADYDHIIMYAGDGDLMISIDLQEP